MQTEDAFECERSKKKEGRAWSKEREPGDGGSQPQCTEDTSPDGGGKAIWQAQLPFIPEAFHVGFSSATHIASWFPGYSMALLQIPDITSFPAML